MKIVRLPGAFLLALIGVLLLAGPSLAAPVTLQSDSASESGLDGLPPISYKMVTEEGEEVSGTIYFTPTPPSGTSTSAETPNAHASGGGTPAWVRILAGVLALAVVVTAVANDVRPRREVSEPRCGRADRPGRPRRRATPRAPEAGVRSGRPGGGPRRSARASSRRRAR